MNNIIPNKRHGEGISFIITQFSKIPEANITKT